MSQFDELKLRRLDLGLLLVFQEIFRKRRAASAAERLGLTQPAISHALGRLRDVTGDPLFVRRPGGMLPTALAVDSRRRSTRSWPSPARRSAPRSPTHPFCGEIPQAVQKLAQ